LGFLQTCAFLSSTYGDQVVSLVHTISATKQSDLSKAQGRKNQGRKDPHDEIRCDPNAVRERAATRAREQVKKGQQQLEALQLTKQQEEMARQRIIAQATGARARPSYLTKEEMAQAQMKYQVLRRVRSSLGDSSSLNIQSGQKALGI